MPMPDYTAKDLTLFSTIIARAACLRGWGADLGAGAGTAIEEVQCMQFRESLYIAGNHGEHAAIASYFRAFGVSNHETFINCLRYSRWLLTIPFVTRTAVAGRSYHGEFSDQEEITLTYAAASLGHVPVLTAGEIAQARALIVTAVLPAAGPLRTLAWFLKKFTGAPALAGLNRPAATAFHYSVNYNGIHAINLLDDSSTVHAELKLMRMLAYAHTHDLMHRKTGRVRVGGLKRTCAFCAAWIGRFQPWMLRAFEVRVDLPADDTRGIADGAGNRPTNVREAEFGAYVQALFNGAANSNCADVAAHAADAQW
ncbi:hypothetical protein KVG96_08170 [Pseudomonas sp. COR58]|uniref:Uncharacterized protein n=1 Tax=Pseudomonas ekonensis TaxID=2842353 RepID=A0ABS6PBS4_9PSED|nr:hypothetical protein [Pseudomonas ekonensis]MBV4457917.1 hypothetical protein [Pseudomonas ekonensis]